MQSTPSCPSKISVGLIPLRSLLHVALCVHIWHPVSAMQSEQTCRERPDEGGFPPWRNDQRSLTR